MTKSIEQQFYEAFDIKPIRKYCGNCEIQYLQYTNPATECCKTCKDYDNIYPPITDHILLELICVHKTYLNYEFHSLEINELKKEILEHLIEEKETRDLDDNYSKDFYNDVRKIMRVENKYLQYELEKKILQNTCKLSEEYEEKIRELIKRLGI